MHCSHCKNPINSINIQDIPVNKPQGGTWNGIAYVCPLCSHIISVAIDPIAIANDIVNGKNI